MSTRILLSIAASCFLYGHPIPPLGTVVRGGLHRVSILKLTRAGPYEHIHAGYLGLTIVFASIGYRIKRKTEGACSVCALALSGPGPVLFKREHSAAHGDLAS